MLSGTFPTNAFSDKLTRLRLLVVSSGMEPERALAERSRSWSWEALKSELGRVPLKKLCERSSVLRCGMRPKSSGILPRSLEFGRERLITLNISGKPKELTTWAHVIPVQRHGVTSL